MLCNLKISEIPSYTLVHWRFFSETCGTVSIIPIYCILHLHSRIALCLSFLQENLEMMYLQFSPFYKDLNIWKSRFLAPLTPLSYIYHCWNDLPGCLIGVYTVQLNIACVDSIEWDLAFSCQDLLMPSRFGDWEATLNIDNECNQMQ